MDLSLQTREVDSRTIVSVGGEIDVYTAPKLRDKITELVGNGDYHLVIDMEQTFGPARSAAEPAHQGFRIHHLHWVSLSVWCDRLTTAWPLSWFNTFVDVPAYERGPR